MENERPIKAEACETSNHELTFQKTKIDPVGWESNSGAVI
jgi:hypothetical protein